MLFWIFLVAVPLIAIGWFLAGLLDDWGGFLMGFGYAFIAAVVSTFIFGLMLFGLWCLIPAEEVQTTETHQLKAINTGSTITGRFMLATGYVDGKRVINYIATDGPAVTVRQASADAAVVYEDGGTSVVITHTTKTNGWILPWGERRRDTFDFHIPTGSVQSDYTIENK